MMNQRNVKGPNQSGLEIIYKSSFDCFVQASLVKHYIPYNNLDVYDPLHNNVVNNSFLDCKKRRINGIIQRIYTNIRKTLSMEYCCILSRFYQIFIYSIYCQIIYNLFAAIIYLLLRVWSWNLKTKYSHSSLIFISFSCPMSSTRNLVQKFQNRFKNIFRIFLFLHYFLSN